MENKLLKLSFIFAIIGIIALFLVSEIREVENTSFADDKAVKVKGRVGKVSSFENVSFLTVRRVEDVEVVVFDNFTVDAGDEIEVIGTFSDDSVIASRIRVVS